MALFSHCEWNKLQCNKVGLYLVISLTNIFIFLPYVYKAFLLKMPKPYLVRVSILGLFFSSGFLYLLLKQ